MRERKNTMAAFGKKRKKAEFPDVIPVSEAIRKGDIFTKLTCLIMGAGNLARKQIIQGLLFLAGELCIYFLYGFLQGQRLCRISLRWVPKRRKRFSMKRHRFMSMRQEITPALPALWCCYVLCDNWIYPAVASCNSLLLYCAESTGSRKEADYLRPDIKRLER